MAFYRKFSPTCFRAVLVEAATRILSFSGTDQLTDWGDNIQQGLAGYSAQYIGALAVASRARRDIIVGHSLGDRLASYVGIYQGRRVGDSQSRGFEY